MLGVLGAQQGAALWARFTPHYTPKHGSWLNPAEIWRFTTAKARRAFRYKRRSTMSRSRH